MSPSPSPPDTTRGPSLAMIGGLAVMPLLIAVGLIVDTGKASIDSAPLRSTLNGPAPLQPSAKAPPALPLRKGDSSS